MQSNRILISTVSNKALEASYAIAKIIAKTKQPHTITESLVLSYREIVKIMINESAVKEVENVSLSNNNISQGGPTSALLWATFQNYSSLRASTS